MHHRDPLAEEVCVSAADLALDAQTEASGCITIVPRSHRLGRLNVVGTGETGASSLGGEKFAPQVSDILRRYEPLPLELEAGELLLLSTATLHSSGRNMTEWPRRAFSLCLMDGATRHVGEWRHAEPVRATVLWGSVDGSVQACLGTDPDVQRERDRERGRL